jgi:hypothetical protein
MRPPLYGAVHDLAVAIVNASADADEARAAESYAALRNLCESNAGGERDHPLQWEALGDFSESHAVALAAYEKGLQCAVRLRLPEYMASIKFALAESHHGEGDVAEARRLIREAKADAKGSADEELKEAINQFLAEIGKG